MPAKSQLEAVGRPRPALASLLTVTPGGDYIAAMRAGPLLWAAAPKRRPRRRPSARGDSHLGGGSSVHRRRGEHVKRRIATQVGG
jgi:hypothetical protein